MKMSKLFESNRSKTIVVGISVLVIMIPLVYSILSFLVFPLAGETKPFLEKPDEIYSNCVRDAAYMRVHHMDYLKEIREEFVRYGNRGEVRLSTCAGCHPSRERFCNQCHDTVNLSLDCFGCHYYPEPDADVQQADKGGEKWIEGSS